MPFKEVSEHIELTLLGDNKGKEGSLIVSAFDEVPIFVATKDKLLKGFKVGYDEFYCFLVKEKVADLIEFNNLDPTSLYIHLGPSLSFCHILADMEQFARLTKLGYQCVCKTINEIPYLDLTLLVVCELRELGIPIENIYQSELDTFETPFLHSKLKGDNKENRFAATFIK